MAVEIDDREPRTEIVRGRRMYGARWARTAELGTKALARRIVLDVEYKYGLTHAPLDPDRPFGIAAWVYRTPSGDCIDFEVYGMTDSLLRDPQWSGQLRADLGHLVAQYNWVNRERPKDQRFGGGAVYLCTEAEERARDGRSGHVRVYRRWLGWLGRCFRPYLPVACD
jgi:hypothetical protein